MFGKKPQPQSPFLAQVVIDAQRDARGGGGGDAAGLSKGMADRIRRRRASLDSSATGAAKGHGRP